MLDAVSCGVLVQVIVVTVLYDRDYYTRHFKVEDKTRHTQPLLPLNTLRNIAADHANTNFIFPVRLPCSPALCERCSPAPCERDLTVVLPLLRIAS